MALTSTFKQWYMKPLPGMNNKLEDLEQQDKYVSLAQNCRFEAEPGTCKKREPISYFNSSAVGSSTPMVGSYRFYKSDGTIVFVSVAGTSAYVGSDSAGTLTAIRTSLTEGKRTCFTTYQDLLIAGNGFDNLWCYDGSSDNVTWELGSCKAVVGSSTGITKTSVSYAVTWDDDAYVPGAVSNEIASLTNEDVSLTNIPVGPVGTTNRKVYRKDSSTSGAYKLVTTIADNTTTSYTDNTPDVSGEASMPAVTDDMPKGSILQVHRERLFIAGDPNAPSKIYYANVYRPWYIQQTTNLDFMEISPDDNDEIMGIPIQLGVMHCVKKNTIRKLHITTAVSGADPSTWYADDPHVFLGSPAQWSITQTPLGIIFLGWDHWYLYDGGSAKPIIDQFDTDEILRASYSDTVGFWHRDVFLAAFTDASSANQYHDTVMRYNFKRDTMSFDTIDANCFAAKTGDDETGELYIGSSREGYLFKASNEEIVYRLRTKTQCNEGTKTDTYVGGTESSPYIQIGSVTSASDIPDNFLIFWDNASTTPGSGWTEITSTYDGKFIKIHATVDTQTTTASHLHSLSGELATSNSSNVDAGDRDNDVTRGNHTHSVAAFNSDGATVVPRYVTYRVFKKNSTTTEYQFPIGAIVMYSEPSAPVGWKLVSNDGYYIRIGSTSLGTATEASHTHDFSGTSTAGPNSNSSWNGSLCAESSHTHTFSGETESVDMSDWELDYCGFTFIKRVGETSTWDGTLKYAYALYDGSGTPGNDWADLTSTYTGNFLKVLTGTPSTGSAANAAHTHTIADFTCDITTANAGGSSSENQGIVISHTHVVSLTGTETSATAPGSVTFRIFRKVIGQMQDYNAALTTHQATGTWTSPSQEIDADTLSKISWNERISGTDNILVHTRTGATKTACEAASWSTGLTDPNGSDIASTANVWFQYKIEFTASDTTDANPTVYLADGYCLKYTYNRANVAAETSVEFRYKMGDRHFDEPMVDKIFKKIQSQHEGTLGSLSVIWTTENSTGTFVIDLTDSKWQERWESFFPSTAMGKIIDIEFYKNDLYDFKLKEVKGLYSPEPIIV